MNSRPFETSGLIEGRETPLGTRIGLAVGGRLAEALGGEIWARPRDGGGPEIGLTLQVDKEIA